MSDDNIHYVWALNKFLGADTWFCTLPARLAGPKDSEHIYLIGLPKKIVSIPHDTISNAFIKEGIVERIEYSPLDTESLMIQFEHSPASIRVYSPDLSEPSVI